MRKRNIMFLIIVLLITGVPFVFGKEEVKEKEQEQEQVTYEQAGYFRDAESLKKITEIMNLVHETFVGEKNPTKEEMYEYAISGIIDNLDDPYSAYLTKDELEDFNEDIDGEYSGVGMEIRKKKGEPLVVVSPFIGSPAFKAGIKINDKIIKIDDKDIIDLTSLDAVKLLKGPKGTKVKVTVSREGLDNTMDITLVRDNIKLEFVESEMLDNNIGYVSLLKFGNDVGKEIENHILDLQKKGMKGLILDLRSNPGGSLQEAQDISSLFLDENLIVSLRYKDGKEQKYNKTRKKIGDFPVVVLINGGSASASEIVTGALKDYKRALIIGEKSFGKGIVQQIIPLGEGDAVKLTIAEYFTPGGNSIHGKGIEPDIAVETEALLTFKGYANESEEAKKAETERIKEVLIKEKGEEEANKIISAGDLQLKRAIEEINKKIK